MEKTYLRELAEQGIRTIPATWVNKHEKSYLPDRLAAQKLQRAVLKPTIGASSYGVYLVSSDNAKAHQTIFEDMLANSAVMVQSVIDEI